MAPARLFTPLTLTPGETLELPGDAAAHARALRLRPGDPVTLFNGEGGEHPSELVSAERRRVTVRVGPHEAVERELPAPVQLLQAVGKAERMDTAIEKATELGATEIVPVLTARTVVRLDDPKRAAKRHRSWMALARGACEQCGRNTPPRIREPLELERAWAYTAAYPLRITLDPLAEASLSGITAATGTSVLIGPEGGLNEDELAAADRHGFHRARSGPRILRTETAAVVALGAIAAALGDL